MKRRLTVFGILFIGVINMNNLDRYTLPHLMASLLDKVRRGVMDAKEAGLKYDRALERHQRRKKRPLPPLLFLQLFLFLLCPLVHAAEIDRNTAVNCIIGEAEAEGQGMAAVAHALHNRGSTRGVYGCASKRVLNRLYSEKTLVQAIKAWEEVHNTPDPTKGATGWGNEKDLEHFRKCKWWKKCRITAKIGNHYFYTDK